MEFHKFKDLQVHEWMQRPARRQVNESKKDAAYEEGNYDYNIWYDKYLTDRNVQIERAPSLTKLKPEIDTGYTKADHFEKKQATYFCVYFARGACTEGVNCRYYHRVPQREDLERASEDNLRDLFGRARHATHKDNLSGIGSFNKECRTLLVSRIKLDPTQDKFRGSSTSMSVRDIVRLLYENFSPWGEIDDIYFNQGRFIAYIKFAHRYYAEFAREAMADQVLVEDITDPIRIQWALESPLDKTDADVASADIKAALAGPQRFAQPRAGFLSRSSNMPNTNDPHMQMSVQDRLKLAPTQLVPQLPATADRNILRKRDTKGKQKYEEAVDNKISK